VNISTGSATTSTRSRGPRIWNVIPLLCGFILLPLGWKRRRRFLRVTALLFLSEAQAQRPRGPIRFR
jgi:hypothetical protein